ncbi:MAG TPA: type II toxin-antitoxin system VapC family toxin, partial [Polyangiaceae bacterium]
MKYLLDTNVCIDYLNGRFPNVVRRVQASLVEDLCVSSVVVAELRYGADRSKRQKRNHQNLDTLLAELRCLPFDEAAARSFGQVRSRLEANGKPIGPYDMQIAAHAIAIG